jgi:hypothetical protein
MALILQYARWLFVKAIDNGDVIVSSKGDCADESSPIGFCTP